MIFDWIFQKKKRTKKPYVLVVLDGYGIAPPSPGNAIVLAKKPNLDFYFSKYVNTVLAASGEAVGLSANEKGSTEVGHLTIGAGRVVLQSLKRISFDIQNGRFFFNRAFLSAANHVRKHNSKIHLVGLIGSGVTHASMDHLMALLKFCRNENLEKTYLHLFTDGRDSPPHEAYQIVEKLEADLRSLGVGKIATIAGRYYGMDRDNRWERTEKAYKAIVLGRGLTAKSALDAIKDASKYAATDEFIEPTVIIDNGKPVATLDDNDALIFFNFRTDRPKQLTMAFCVPDFEKMRSFEFGYDPETRRERGEVRFDKTFEREKVVKNLFLVTMTEYQRNLPVSEVAFRPEPVISPLGDVLSQNNKTQVHLAESEKEKFVKYYFNGLREEPFPGEKDVIVPSLKIKTYDLKPEMALPKIAAEFRKNLNKDEFDFFVVNFANPDMVGHSGNLKATIRAIEYVDKYLSDIVKMTLDADGIAFVTADHGNAEELLKFPESSFFITTGQGEVDTDHSNNPVPFVIIGDGFEKGKLEIRPQGALCDIAPTILKVMSLPQPAEMTGKSLI